MREWVHASAGVGTRECKKLRRSLAGEISGFPQKKFRARTHSRQLRRLKEEQHAALIHAAVACSRTNDCMTMMCLWTLLFTFLFMIIQLGGDSALRSTNYLRLFKMSELFTRL